MRRLLLTAALLVAAPPALAHPHVFVDASVDFVLDAEGRVERLRIGWFYDPLFSLYLLGEMGIDAFAPADEAVRAAIAEDQTNWIEGFEGNSFLLADGEPIRLSGPLNPTGDIVNGRVAASHERRLETPLDPRETEIVVEVYDPVYFIAYTVSGPTRVEGPGAEACRAAVDEFKPTDGLLALQGLLLSLAMEDIPEDPTVGRLFTDRVRLTCG